MDDEQNLIVALQAENARLLARIAELEALEALVEKRREEKRRYNQERDPAAKARDRGRYYLALKAKVFAYYGTSCACCGSTKKLNIDHPKGGGSAHRKKLFGSNSGGMNFYRWLVREGFPEGYRTLCTPCNQASRYGGVCRLHPAA